jgi:hypothetical protein
MARGTIKQKTKKRKKSVVEEVELSKLKPHPRNYRVHPESQLEHIEQSIRENGFYRNIVVARDYTILAGHGVTEAATRMKLKKVPVIKLDVGPDEPTALKVLTGDNEISNLVEIDDRELTQMLKDILDMDGGLLGTGYDEQMLAGLLYVTRPADEIQDFDAAAEWVGMPEYKSKTIPRMIISFRNTDDREKFAKKLEEIGGNVMVTSDKTAWSGWWPEKKRDDLAAVAIEG